MNAVIEEIYRTHIVRDAAGIAYPLNSAVDPVEGAFLHELISSDCDVRQTLEVGCAHGLSSLFICEALCQRTNAGHVIIDPNQSEFWHGIGVANLERAGFDCFRLIEEPSEFALPKLLGERPGSFDLVFIDGWHTFDQTMLDLYYANRLIRVGGYIAVDDCNWSSVAKAVSYFGNYPAYEPVAALARMPASASWKRTAAKICRTVIPPALAGSMPRNLYDRYYVRMLYPSIVAMRKIAEDTRDWEWFRPF